MIYLNTYKLLKRFEEVNNIKTENDRTLYEDIMLSIYYTMDGIASDNIKLGVCLYNLYLIEPYKSKGITEKDLNEYLSDAYNDFNYIYGLIRKIYNTVYLNSKSLISNYDIMKSVEYITCSKNTSKDDVDRLVKKANDLLLEW